MASLKGVLALHGEDEKFVFQGVHEHVTLTPTAEVWEKDEVRKSKMVFIGRYGG